MSSPQPRTGAFIFVFLLRICALCISLTVNGAKTITATLLFLIPLVIQDEKKELQHYKLHDGFAFIKKGGRKCKF